MLSRVLRVRADRNPPERVTQTDASWFKNLGMSWPPWLQWDFVVSPRHQGGCQVLVSENGLLLLPPPSD